MKYFGPGRWSFGWKDTMKGNPVSPQCCKYFTDEAVDGVIWEQKAPFQGLDNFFIPLIALLKEGLVSWKDSQLIFYASSPTFSMAHCIVKTNNSHIVLKPWIWMNEWWIGQYTFSVIFQKSGQRGIWGGLMGQTQDFHPEAAVRFSCETNSQHWPLWCWKMLLNLCSPICTWV